MISLPIIVINIVFFVVRFYYHFLQTKAGMLFKKTTISKQHKMFGSALNAILNYITDPVLLENYIHNLGQTHAEYGVISAHIDYFIDSFMKALKETLPETIDAKIYTIWSEILEDLMADFKVELFK